MIQGRVESRSRPLGLESAEPVVVMENHDGAYHVWRERGCKERILIHVDAHHDMWWIPERGTVSIANFLCQALRDDLVREVVWVVPDPTWETPSTRRPLLQHLRELGKKYPGGVTGIRATDDRISAVALGKPLSICPLGSVPSFPEPVLLDIDIDFLLIPHVAFERWDRHSRLPWRWPEELVAGLESAGVRAEVATIVYSVEGGYTPLKWKYLGDELELRLKQPEGSEDQIRALMLIRGAAEAADRGDAAGAERIYLEAERLLPASAAPCWRLAHLYAEAGRMEEGRQYYQRALLRDPSYRTVYNSAGLWRLFEGRFRESEREHRRILALDPDDAYAHYGMGRLTARRKRWVEAEASFRKSLGSNPELIDAWRGLGKTLARQGRRQEAIEAYTRSLRLVLAGHRPLGAPIATFPSEHRLDDPAHWDIHRRLARLYELQGAHVEAIHGYRMAIAAGCGDFATRSRLARLYLKQRQWGRGGEQAWQAVQAIPNDLWRAVRKLDAELRRGVRNAWRGLKSAPAR